MPHCVSKPPEWLSVSVSSNASITVNWKFGVLQSIDSNAFPTEIETVRQSTECVCPLISGSNFGRYDESYAAHQWRLHSRYWRGKHRQTRKPIVNGLKSPRIDAINWKLMHRMANGWGKKTARFLAEIWMRQTRLQLRDTSLNFLRMCVTNLPKDIGTNYSSIYGTSVSSVLNRMCKWW